jgi:hypothetical protein
MRRAAAQQRKIRALELEDWEGPPLTARQRRRYLIFPSLADGDRWLPWRRSDYNIPELAVCVEIIRDWRAWARPQDGRGREIEAVAIVRMHELKRRNPHQWRVVRSYTKEELEFNVKPSLHNDHGAVVAALVKVLSMRSRELDRTLVRLSQERRQEKTSPKTRGKKPKNTHLKKDTPF